VGPSVLDFQGLSVKQHYPGLSILSLLPKITSDYKDHILGSAEVRQNCISRLVYVPDSVVVVLD